LTPTLCVPPPSGVFTEVGDRPKLHAAPAWLTRAVCPPTDSVAVRAMVDALASVANCTVPPPDPLPPPVMRSHDALLEAVHVQPEPALTPTLCVPPPTGVFNEVGVR